MPLTPITDRAEVAIDFPEKSFMGSFGQDSAYEIEADAEGVTLRLVRIHGRSRTIELHVHYLLFAEMVAALAGELEAKQLPDETRRRVLLKAAESMQAALQPR